MSDCASQTNTLESKRGDALVLSFNLNGFASYAGLAASAQLRVACGDDVDFRSRLACNTLVGTFTVVCNDNGDGTATIVCSLTGDQTADIVPGTYAYDVKITMDGWGPYSTPVMYVIMKDGVTQ